MDENTVIITIEGEALAALIEDIEYAKAGGLYRLRIAVDGGLKVKANEGMWSPALNGARLGA